MAHSSIYEARVRAQTREIARRILRETLDDMERHAKQIAGTGPYVTGRLANSIHSRVEDTPTGATGTLGSRLRYAASTNTGAKRHIILPHGNYPLHFYWRKVGRTVNLAIVRHPGQRGKLWLFRTFFEIPPRHGFTIRRVG